MGATSKSSSNTSKSVNRILGKIDWILGFLMVIIIIITLVIFAPNYQHSVEKFINLDIQYQQAGGGYTTGETILTKWNGDNFQKLKLNFSNTTTQIDQLKLDFKDIKSNNLYTYSAENKVGTAVYSFDFNLNLPDDKTFMMYVYINGSSEPTFMTYIKTSPNYFRFTDINENELQLTDIANTLQINVLDPDNGSTAPRLFTNGNPPQLNLGVLNMQPYNMVKIPVIIPNLSTYKNKLKASTSIDAPIKAKHDAKLAALDNFVFKEIEASITVIGLPPNISSEGITSITLAGAASGVTNTTTTIDANITNEYETYGLSPDELAKFTSKYPNRVKVQTAGVDGCIQGDINKCAIQVKNLVNGARYKLVIRAVYQQLSSIEPNIRYTEPQTIIFSVDNSKNTAADLNTQIKLVDRAKQYVLNREQKDFIKTDQQRQDYIMSKMEFDISNLGRRMQFAL
jgi:hypothetical protein